MNRKFKGILTTGCSAFIATIVFAQTSGLGEDDFCANSVNVQFNHQLPMNHPVNRCAVKQHTDVSWSTWLTGRSKSYQFHYLDLLELLSRNSDESSSRRLRR
jgi:hypothetical protein